jgi:hypothetical protein
MAKKDTSIHLDIRSTEESAASGHAAPERGAERAPQEGEKTVVKNANAAGLGAMERSDQSMDNEDHSLDRY